jgi:malonate transporter
MTTILLNSLLPIFAVMALGYFAGWVRDIDNQHVGELNALVMDFALPASLFVATATTPSATLLAQWPLLLTLAISMLALYALSYWMQRRLFALGSTEASVQALTIAFPNYAAAGLPLIAAVFAPSRTIYVALAVASGSILLSPLTLAILEADKASAGGSKGSGLVFRAVGRSLLNPVVLSPIIGIAVAFLRIPIADAVRESFMLIGQATGGVALFLTGLILSSQSLVVDRNVISGALLKNMAQPLFVIGLVVLLPMHKDTARAAILLTALPSGFFGALFGLRYGVESHAAGSTLIVSTILSALTLTAVVILTAAN